MTAGTTEVIAMSASVQADVAVATIVVSALLLAVALFAHRRSTARAPGMLQLLCEMSIGAADRTAGNVPERVRSRVIGTAVTLFWFVTAANWLHLIPGSALPAPTSDINLTLALAVTAMTVVHVTAIQVRGVRGYLRHYLSPWWLAPAKVFDELVKPVSLSLRLFGMMFASALMVVLIDELLPAPVAVVPHVLWTLFDVFAGAIQALIFAMLTLLYFRAVLSGEAEAAYSSEIPRQVSHA
jgi:F-type H+-transporting ATPase subunit a